MPFCKRYDVVAAACEKLVIAYDQRGNPMVDPCLECRIEFLLPCSRHNLNFPTKYGSGPPCIFDIRLSVTTLWIDEHPYRRCCRHELSQQFMALSAERDRVKAYAGDISPRPSKARDETQLHRIVTASYHNWYGRCGGFGR